MVMILERVEHPGERHLSIAVVVAVASPSGGDVETIWSVGAVGLDR